MIELSSERELTSEEQQLIIKTFITTYNEKIPNLILENVRLVITKPFNI